MTAAKLALHHRISADLAERIHSGAWPPGSRIPFEHDLMATYGCARATVNKAVQALAAAGLIVRRRRAGSFVAPPRIQSAVLEIPELQAEVTARGQAYGYGLISTRRRSLNPGDADEEALGPGAAVLAIECRHFANGRPFAFEERLINLTTAPLATRADFQAVSPGAWLLEHIAWSEAEHRIGAIKADARLAGYLDLDIGDACLTLKRWTWRSGDGVTFARQVFPAGALELVARFAPTVFR